MDFKLFKISERIEDWFVAAKKFQVGCSMECFLTSLGKKGVEYNDKRRVKDAREHSFAHRPKATSSSSYS